MKYLSYPLLIILLVLVCIEFFQSVMYAFRHLTMYQWLLYGFAAYFVIRRFDFFARNEQWLQTTSHEATHALVGMMFLHKIHSLEAREGHGVVYHSGRNFGSIFISLAPYCFPVLTYALLFLRLMGANRMLYVFDILIGFTLAFHVLCFWMQTGRHQPDIQGQGYLRSFLFLFLFWFFNASVILLSIRKGIIGAFGYLFQQYWGDIVQCWHLIF